LDLILRQLSLGPHRWNLDATVFTPAPFVTAGDPFVDELLAAGAASEPRPLDAESVCEGKLESEEDGRSGKEEKHETCERDEQKERLEAKGNDPPERLERRLEAAEQERLGAGSRLAELESKLGLEAFLADHSLESRATAQEHEALLEDYLDAQRSDEEEEEDGSEESEGQRQYKLMTAERLKKEGNDFVISKKYGDAIDKYSKALDCLSGVTGDEISALQVVLLSNQALCHLGAEDYPAALEASEDAMKIDPKCAKALFRHGLAKAKLGCLGEAVLYVRRAAELVPGDKVIAAELEKLCEAVGSVAEREDYMNALYGSGGEESEEEKGVRSDVNSSGGSYEGSSWEDDSDYSDEAESVYARSPLLRHLRRLQDQGHGTGQDTAPGKATGKDNAKGKGKAKGKDMAKGKGTTKGKGNGRAKGKGTTKGKGNGRAKGKGTTKGKGNGRATGKG